jgi:hypothetical protein
MSDLTTTFIAGAGRNFRSARLTDQERQIVTAAIGRKQFRLRECFANACRLVLADRSGLLTYVEGYRASCPGGLHGWAAINGKIVDVTVYTSNGASKYLGTFPTSERYFGVEFSRDILAVPSVMLTGSVLDDWERGWPAERGAYDQYRIARTRAKRAA